MQDALRSWHDFYLLVGGASATLLGLVFISAALVVNLPSFPDDEDRALFSSPIIAHFSYALGLSALCLAPFRAALPFGILVSISGAFALYQSLFVLRLMRRRHRSKQAAALGVWMIIAVAPLIAAFLCAVSGVLLLLGDLRGLDTLAPAIASLDLIGLLNAWRLFLWMVSQHRPKTSGPR